MQYIARHVTVFNHPSLVFNIENNEKQNLSGGDRYNAVTEHEGANVNLINICKQKRHYIKH